MQNKLKHYILAFLFLVLGTQVSYTQTYPVTISTQLTQPSPIYLSNYANTASINSPIKVQLILNDLSIMNRQVRLKCYFQGAVSFVTNDFVVGAAPIYLEGGFPTQLTNVELGSYFEFQNIKGINPNQYGQPLPEGIYTISFEVYDFATNKKLSKKSSVTTVIFQNEPPFLNLPANKAEIVEQNIQNIIFSWTPRSINVSNVEYEFSLVEIWNSNTPIQNAFAYSPPLYTTTTRNTTVQYSIAEPQLIPGKTYAWRVKAKALVGAEEIGVFKNNGYSETYSFKYLTFCKPPLAITTTDVSQEQAKVTWSGAVDNFDYQVNYREKNADSKWYKLVTPREYVLISNLKPKTTYEYTVGAACDPNEYTHGNIQEFTTLAQDEIAFTGCGIKPDPTALTNKTPLPALFPNDVVTAGDFPIVVLKSTGSNGTFSGEGYVTLPFLEKFRKLIDAAAALAGSDEKGDSKANIGKYTRIRITFKNIGINTDFKLISGEIVASYDAKWGSMIDGDKAVNDLLGDTGTVIPIDVQFEIKSVVKNADGTLTITGTNGVVVQQPKTDNDVIITDRNGKQYAVSPSAPVGNIESTGKAAPGGVPTPQNTNGMGSGGAIKQISSPDVSITFAAGTGFYSLDENPNQDPKLKDNTKLNNTYDVIPKKDGTNYYVHYKAISDAPKAEDHITAKATFSNGKTAADIVFKTENGTEIPSTWSGNVATLTLKRTLDFAKESILATVKPPVQKDSIKVTTKYDIAGTLNMWHVTNKKVNVTLVGLNGGQTPTQSQAQEYLNSIYGKAGIQFEVSTIKVDIAKSWGTSIETGDSDLLNTYTDGQQTITNDFQAQLGSNYKSDTYYVFFTGVPASNGDSGFMPLKRQFGFVFAKSDGNKLRTLAHELGHGFFGLQHPSTTYNIPTNSGYLMDKDYSSVGILLTHNDWEIMHAPGLQLYQFTQGSSAGTLAGGFGLSPEWEFVRTNESTVLSGDQIPKLTEGMLGGFESTVGNVTVNYIWNTTDKKYKLNGNKSDYEAVNYTKTPSDKAIIWLVYKNNETCNNRKYIRTNYGEIKQYIVKHDQSGLDAYISRIDKIAKADKLEIYSNILGCVGTSTSGDGTDVSYSDYLANLGKVANKGYKDDLVNVNANENHVYDYAAIITEKEKNKILSQMGNIKTSTGIATKIFLTDTKTLPAKRKEITDYLASLKGLEIALWIDFNISGKATVKTILGDKVKGSGNQGVNNFLSILNEVVPKFDGTYTYFNPLTAILDGIASIVTQAKIPERFYNPEITTKDYNPVLYYVSLADPFSWNLLINDKVLEKQNIKITNTALVNSNHIYFAIKCGVWNGLVDQVAGLADMAAIIANLIDGGDRASEMWEGIKKLDVFCTESTKDSICIWTLVNKAHSGQTCQIAETVGVDMANVLTVAVSFAKVGKVAEISKIIESLDVMQQVLKYSGKLIKITLKGTGTATKFVYKVTKAFIKPGLKLSKAGKMYCALIPIVVDLTENLDNAIKKAQELLNKNPKELEDKLTILTKEDVDGNLIAEINDGGQKVEILLNESEEQLRKSTGEIVGDVIDIVVYKKSLITKGFSKISELSDDVLKKIKELDESYLTKLEADLSSNSSGEKIKDLLATVDDVDIWKILKDNPELAWKTAKENPLWEKWSKGNFFKTITKAGREFGEFVESELKDINSQVYKKIKSEIADLDQRTILSQVQFCLTGKAPCNGKGEFFIPDFVAVMEKTNSKGQKYLDVIVLDAKLSKNTSWSPNQTIAKDMNGWVIKSVSPKNIIKGSKVTGFDYGAEVIKNGNFKKIYKEGSNININ
jgi:hypothetical protein